MLYSLVKEIFKMTWGVIVIVINPSKIVILRFDDAKPSCHNDAVWRHQIDILSKSSLTPTLDLGRHVFGMKNVSIR